MTIAPIVIIIIMAAYFIATIQVNADQIAFGILRIICALILSLLLEIHTVFLQKSAFIRTQILK